MSTDLLYYIMDYSGRYYKVDKGDQLVVSSEGEATVFTFAQANSRICVGKKSSFYCMIPIEEETDEACEIPEEGVPEEMEAVFGKEEKKQYIGNLRMAIREIDQEIEEILLETETAVTQIAGNDSEQIHLVETIQDMVG